MQCLLTSAQPSLGPSLVEAGFFVYVHHYTNYCNTATITPTTTIIIIIAIYTPTLTTNMKYMIILSNTHI